MNIYWRFITSNFRLFISRLFSDRPVVIESVMTAFVICGQSCLLDKRIVKHEQPTDRDFQIMIATLSRKSRIQVSAMCLFKGTRGFKSPINIGVKEQLSLSN